MKQLTPVMLHIIAAAMLPYPSIQRGQPKLAESDYWGETLGSGRYGRPHSRRNKHGSHKQTMRKLGKLR